MRFFRTEEDRWSWDRYIEQCDLIELSDTQRQEVKSSFEYLRRTLGEGFLRRADQQRNPLFFWYFRNAAPMARLSMVRFADALRACERAGNYNRILRRIKKPKNVEHDLAEAISLVEVAEKFASSGFDVEFEPAVQVVDRRGTVKTKRPDKRNNGEAEGRIRLTSTFGKPLPTLYASVKNSKYAECEPQERCLKSSSREWGSGLTP